MPAKSKVCTKCGKRKKLEAFATCRRRKDGKQCHCRECKAAYAKALYARPQKRAAMLERGRQWVAANRDRVNRRARARRKADPAKARMYNSKRAEYKRAWYLANFARMRALAHARYVANKKEHLAYSKAWCQANRERVKAHKAAWYQANREWAVWNNSQTHLLRGGI